VQNGGEFIYQLWKEARSSERSLNLILNSMANRYVFDCIKYAQDKYNNPDIKADVCISTGNPFSFIGSNVVDLKKISLHDPVVIGSWSDPVFTVPIFIEHEPNIFPNILNIIPTILTPGIYSEKYVRNYSNSVILEDVRHLGSYGYFNHPSSVNEIIKQIGYTPLPDPLMEDYSRRRQLEVFSRIRFDNNWFNVNNPVPKVEFPKPFEIYDPPKTYGQAKIPATRTWEYIPQNGFWPGKYDFRSIAPADYYLHQGQYQAPTYKFEPPKTYNQYDPNNALHAPADYYLHQGQYQVPTPVKIYESVPIWQKYVSPQYNYYNSYQQQYRQIYSPPTYRYQAPTYKYEAPTYRYQTPPTYRQPGK